MFWISVRRGFGVKERAGTMRSRCETGMAESDQAIMPTYYERVKEGESTMRGAVRNMKKKTMRDSLWRAS
jgi:hypothetical protein